MSESAIDRRGKGVGMWLDTAAHQTAAVLMAIIAIASLAWAVIALPETKTNHTTVYAAGGRR